MRRILLLILSLHAIDSYSQSGLILGYNVGYGGAREINRVIYEYNLANNSNGLKLEKNMPYLHTYGGVVVGWLFGDEDAGFELKWSGKHSVIGSKFKGPSGEEMERQIKFRTNSLLGGFLFHPTKRTSAGISLDFSSWKGWMRKADADKIHSTEWHKEFVVNTLGGLGWLDKTQLGSTIFYQVNAGIVGFRLYYQYQFMKMNLDNLDYDLLGYQVDYNYWLRSKFSNVGLEMNIRIGKKD